mmetsp:Transcript_5060/g.13127  ORF Transcript_5060/g.13127 Transcript_5060/m.13127 type:complete len:198 (+) Transcript_5060:119-712(+)
MAVARIRLATAADAARCLAIYRPAIEESAASFETEVPTAEAVAARIESTLTTHPWVVAEGPDGRVVGYAYGATYRTRRAYQWTVEASVYVDPTTLRRGVGRALYTALFGCLRHQGYCQVLAGMTMPNDRSVGLHARMGFTEVGVYRKTGCKFGRFHDVRWVQLELQDQDPAELAPPTPLAECRADVEAILGQFSVKQ